MMLSNLTAIGPHTLTNITRMVSFSILSAKRTNIRTFGNELWNAVRKRITPTPREMRIEINPNLKRRYSAENKTFVFRLFLQPKAEMMVSQFYLGGSEGVGMGSSYVETIEQTQAARRELEAEKQMVQDGQLHMEKMEATKPILEQTASRYEKNLVNSEKDKQDQIAQQQQVEMKQKQVEKMEEAEKILTHQPTSTEAGGTEPPPQSLQEKAQDTEVTGRHGQRKKVLATDESTYDQAVAQPVDQQTQKSVQEEELKAESEELRIFQDVLKNDVLPIYQARVVKQPEILANAAGEGQGQQVVFEVDTNSFNDTRRVNANFQSISFGTSFGAI